MLAARDDDLDEQLVRLQRRLVEAGDQLLDRHLPLSAHASGHGPCAEGDEHRRRVGRVIGVGEHAADGRLVAHARARDDRERVRQRRPPLAHDRRQLDRAMARERADAEIPVGADVVQPGNTLQAEKCLRRHQPAVDEDADEGPAGDDSRVRRAVRPAAPVPRRARPGRATQARSTTATASSYSGCASSRARGTRIRSSIQRSCAFDALGAAPAAREPADDDRRVHLQERERVGRLDEILVLGPAGLVGEDQPADVLHELVLSPLPGQPVAHDRGRALRVQPPVLRVLLRCAAQVLDRPAREVTLHVVRDRREPERLGGARIELEQPVARPHEVLRVPVRLDPHERAVLQGQSVVTGRDWSRYSCPPAIAHSTSCGPPNRSWSAQPSSASIVSSSGCRTPPFASRSRLTEPLRSTA